MISYTDAILNLRPNAEFSISLNDYDTLEWFDTEQSKPTENEILEKISEMIKARPLKFLRMLRNNLLKNSDWTQFRDVSLSNNDEWVIYRQALRDLPETSDPELDEDDNLINVNWPEVPTNG